MNLNALVVVIPSLLLATPCLAQPTLIVPDIMAVGQPALVAPAVTAVGQTSSAAPAASANSSQEIVVPSSSPAPAVPASPPAKTYERPSRRLRFGPEVGLFVPTKNLVRSRFGNDWFSLGIGLGQYDSAPVTGQFSIDIELLSNVSGNNAAYLLPLGAEYRIGLTQNRSTTPYLAATADVVPTYIRSTTDNVPYGIRTGYSGGLFGGLDFGGGAVQLQGGYRWFSKVAGYDFSGAEVNLGFRF